MDDPLAAQVDTCQMLVGQIDFETCRQPATGTMVSDSAVIRVCRQCTPWAAREGMFVQDDQCLECDGEFEHWPDCSLYTLTSSLEGSTK